MRFLSTRTHGVLDYLSAAAMLLGPRLLNWSDALIVGATGLCVATILYSLATRYELGAMRWLPMKVHLALDIVSGVLVASLPFWLFRDLDNAARAVLIGFGLFEITVGLVTSTEPSILARGASHRQPGSAREVPGG